MNSQKITKITKTTKTTTQKLQIEPIDFLFNEYINLGKLQDFYSNQNPNSAELIEIARKRCILSTMIRNFDLKIKRI